MTASCSDCNTDPKQRDYWNCSGDVNKFSWRDEINGEDYYVCPVKLIPQTILDFYAELSCYKSGIALLPEMCKITDRYVEAVNLYEKYYNQFLRAAQGRTQE